MDKYTVTVETNYGTEVACQLMSPKKNVGLIDEAKAVLDKITRDFPKHTYRLYRLRMIKI